MDYELKKGGNSFKDPEKKNEFQAYWVVIPIDYQFSEGLEVKVLDELFIPFGTGNFSITPPEKRVKIYKEIEMRSNELIDSSKPSKKAKVAFTAYGTIRVEDDILSGLKGSQIFLPIQGVKVRAKRNSITSETTTDASGNFTVPYNFAGNIDSYSIVWQNTSYDITDGSYGLAITTRNNHSTPWIPQITKAVSSEVFRYAHVFRAAYNYYYNIGSLQIDTPHLANSAVLGGVGNKLKIGVRDGSWLDLGSHYYGSNRIFNASQAIIENDDVLSNSEFNSRYLFSQTTHELSHAKHWSYGMTDSQYCLNRTKGTYAESYAMVCEDIIVNQVYSQLAWPSSYSYFDRRKLQPKLLSFWQQSAGACLLSRERYYTPVFIDMIDYRNQYLDVGITCPNDNFGGFTLKFIEDRVKLHPTDWESLKTQIKADNTTGNSNLLVDYIFNLYKNI
jgi:hypothetical protein